MRFGSLFAGVGGMDLGLERAGMTCAWQVEIDGFCQRVLAKHWPNVKRYGNIRTLDTGELERVDLICGGFPCQPVSVAGKHLAQADERWLWPEFNRVVSALRPRFVLVENVPGLTSLGLANVLSDLARSGYNAEWDCLAAGYFGAPHLRERIYLLAYPNEEYGKTRVGPVSLRQGAVFAGRDCESFPIWLQASDSFIGMDDGVSPAVYTAEGMAYGNAVIPQVVQWLGERIMELE